MIPIRHAEPIAHARVQVFGSDVQPDRADQDMVRWEDDRKVDERAGVEVLLLARDPLRGCAIGIGMRREGAGCDLFHSGKALHVCGIAQLELSEQKPIGSEGGECRHILDETTERGGLTITP